MSLRVRFCETDLMGIVHHANYLQYFEMGRVEWLRRRGVTYASWAARGFHLPVVEVSIRYRKPARFDDELLLETRLSELRGYALRFEYDLRRGDELLVEGMTRLASIREIPNPQAAGAGAEGAAAPQNIHKLTPFPDDMMAILKRGEPT
jgi:acyl-CoA thioester hydrolase